MYSTIIRQSTNSLVLHTFYVQSKNDSLKDKNKHFEKFKYLKVIKKTQVLIYKHVISHIPNKNLYP